MKRPLAVVASLSLLGSGLASADVVSYQGQPSPDFRLSGVRLGIGVANPENASSGVGLAVDVGLGTLVTPWLHLSSGVSYWSADVDRTSLGSSATGSVSDLALRSDVRWQTPAIRGAQPYLLTGLGFHSVSASIDDDQSLEDALSGVSLGADIGVGLETEKLGFGWNGELRRSFVSDVDHWMLTVGVGWTFGATPGTQYREPRHAAVLGAVPPGPPPRSMRRFKSVVESVIEENQRLRAELRETSVAPAARTTPLAAEPPSSSRTLSAELHRALLDIARAQGDPLALSVGDDGYRLMLSGSFLFPPGSAELSVTGRESLRRVSRMMHRYRDVVLQIEGHADGSGSAKQNDALSEARARAVMSEVVGRGITARRVEAVGFGSRRPVADDDTPTGRARNRRVELVFRVG